MLTKTTIIRAWKDKAFRATLTAEELQNLPAHPSGLIEIPDEVLINVAGATAYPSCQGAPASTCFACDYTLACGGGGPPMSSHMPGGVCAM